MSINYLAVAHMSPYESTTGEPLNDPIVASLAPT